MQCAFSAEIWQTHYRHFHMKWSVKQICMSFIICQDIPDQINSARGCVLYILRSQKHGTTPPPLFLRGVVNKLDPPPPLVRNMFTAPKSYVKHKFRRSFPGNFLAQFFRILRNMENYSSHASNGATYTNQNQTLQRKLLNTIHNYTCTTILDLQTCSWFESNSWNILSIDKSRRIRWLHPLERKFVSTYVILFDKTMSWHKIEWC